MSHLTAKDFFKRLRGIQRTPTSFMVHCPAHNDKNPSLSISDGNNKILFHCFAGCSKESIINEFKKLGLWNQGAKNV